MEMEVTDCGGV